MKKEIIVIATLFRKLQTLNDLVRPLSNKHRFREPFASQHVKGSQTFEESAWEHFNHIFSSLWENLICKISPLVICYILGMFRNTLTPNDKYLVWDCENWPPSIQMQLSLKPKTCSDSFLLLLESTSNFKHFEKKADGPSNFISEITDCQRLG